jgi:2',3'-cyclic-nucleotide 2'-phosphodiesterase (5'-nucleotidase family)
MMKNNSRKFLNWSILVILVLISTTGAMPAARATVDIQILNVSDWHGQLDPLNWWCCCHFILLES